MSIETRKFSVLINYPSTNNDIQNCGLYFILVKNRSDIDVSLEDPSYYVQKEDPDGVFYFKINGRANAFGPIERIYGKGQKGT